MGIFSGGKEGIFVLGVFIILLIVCIVCIFSIRSHKAKAPAMGRFFSPFYIEDGRLIINNAMSKQYQVSEISHIILGFSRGVGKYSSGREVGYFRIVATNGKKSIKFLFNGSVYTQKQQFIYTKSDLLKAMDLMEKELSVVGIRCVRNEKNKA